MCSMVSCIVRKEEYEEQRSPNEHHLQERKEGDTKRNTGIFGGGEADQFSDDRHAMDQECLCEESSREREKEGNCDGDEKSGQMFDC